MKNNNTLTVGEKAKRMFTYLLENNLLSQVLIDRLRDKDYCRNHLGVHFPVIVDIDKDQFDNVRYYADIVINNYRISNYWFENREKINSWLSSNIRSILGLDGNNQLSIGRLCQRVFTTLLELDLLSQSEINELRDASYCSKNFGLYIPVIVDINVDTFAHKDYYGNIILGKYRVCSQWHKGRHTKKLDAWVANKF